MLAKPGKSISFTCIPPFVNLVVDSIAWKLNGTRQEDLDLQNVETQFSSIASLGTLTITEVPLSYDTTIVQCIVTFIGGIILESNLASITISQGMLLAVRQLRTSCSYKLNPKLKSPPTHIHTRTE